MKILHIEDDELTVELVQKLCGKAEGLQTTSVHSLTAAEYRLTNEAFDVVLVDLHLPDSMGIDTVLALMRYGVPVVVLTADPTGEFIETAVDMGVADYLRKSELPQLNLPLRLQFVHRKHQKQRAAKRAESGLSFEGVGALRQYLSCAVLT